jgi:hypothetical protein
MLGEGRLEAEGERAGSIQGEERQNGTGRRDREEASPRFEAAPPLETVTRASEPESPSETQAESERDPDRPRRRGWWQR